MAYSGKYTPINYKKYAGDHTNIWYRSLWERKAMQRFDLNPNVIEWSSEEVVIPYISPLDRKVHRYFPDFLIKLKNGNVVETILIEIKPDSQTKPPEKKKKATKKYITEIATWGVNEAKWIAAREYCLDRGWQFRVLTEYDLKIK